MAPTTQSLESTDVPTTQDQSSGDTQVIQTSVVDPSPSVNEPSTVQASGAAPQAPETTNALSILSQAESSEAAADPGPSIVTADGSPETTQAPDQTDDPTIVPSGATIASQPLAGDLTDATAAPGIIATVNSQPVVGDPSDPGVISVATQALSLGGSAQTVRGATLSYGSAGIVSDGVLTIPISTAVAASLGANLPTALQTNGESIYTVDGQAYTIQSGGSGVIVNGNPLSADSPATTLGGQVVGLASATVVSGYAIQGKTLVAGGSAVTDQGTVYSARSSGSGILIAANGASITLSASGSSPLTLAGSVIATPIAVSQLGPVVIGTGAEASTLSSPDVLGDRASASTGSQLIVGSQTFTEITQTNGATVFANAGTSFTLAASSPAVIVDGEEVSALSSGNVRVGTSIVSGVPGTQVATPDSVISVGSQVLTEIGASTGIEVFANAQTTFTISSGGETTINGELVSAVQSAEIVVGTATFSVAPAATSHPVSVITVGSNTFTEIATSNGESVFADASTSWTISQGGPAQTIDGVTVTALPNGEVLIGSSTVSVRPDESIFTFGGQTVTAVPGSNGDEIMALGSSTVTLSRGGPAVTIGSAIFSEAPNGAITAESNTASPAGGTSASSATTTSSATRTLQVNWCCIAGLIAVYLLS